MGTLDKYKLTYGSSLESSGLYAVFNETSIFIGPSLLDKRPPFFWTPHPHFVTQVFSKKKKISKPNPMPKQPQWHHQALFFLELGKFPPEPLHNCFHQLSSADDE